MQMHDADDMELLREYDRQGSEAAFAALVQRHVNLVYSTAFRHVGIDAHAGEITQAVFIILARKAARLRPHTLLESWLYETTRLTALSFLRGERRRQFREQEAYMQSTLDENSAPDAVWAQLAPLLDEAMARLGKKDREAVILRFFKEQSVREVAATLRINEAAAQRRTLRALEKLRKFFTKRGVSSSTAIIAGTISANSVQAAPVTLAKTVTAVAIAKGAVASGSTLTLIKGALKIMAWSKVNTLIVASAVVLLAAGSTSVVVKIIDERPMVVQGKTESEWINSIVYNGDDNQRKRWHSLGPKGIKMLVRALQTPPNEQNEELAHNSRITRMNAGSLLCDLANYYPQSAADFKSAIPKLINLLETRENESDQRVRQIELACFETPIQSMDDKEKAALLPVLFRAMQSTDATVRNNALGALQYCPNQKEIVAPVIVNALQDPVPTVRMVAVKALNQVDPQNPANSESVSVLVGCLNAPPDNFSGAAAQAATLLGELHREPDVAVPALIQALQSDDNYLRERSATALGKFGSQAKPAVSALTKALEDSDANVRRQVAKSLKLINSAPAK
jgi:RNA polymerase sigma factor (sigma-70 family)